MSDLNKLAADVANLLFENTEVGDFQPHADWHDLGLLIRALEARGLHLMLNSATKPEGVRRIASLHGDTGWGYPCIGGSEWGFFPTVGEAVLRAAHEALIKPRA